MTVQIEINEQMSVHTHALACTYALAQTWTHSHKHVCICMLYQKMALSPTTKNALLLISPLQQSVNWGGPGARWGCLIRLPVIAAHLPRQSITVIQWQVDGAWAGKDNAKRRETEVGLLPSHSHHTTHQAGVCNPHSPPPNSPRPGLPPSSVLLGYWGITNPNAGLEIAPATDSVSGTQTLW